MASPDAIIIGGGIIGLTAALELADAGLRVSVYDRGELGMEASWAGAGIIPPSGPGPKATPFDELRALSSGRFAEYISLLQRQTQIDCGYRICGGIEIVDPRERQCITHWEREQIIFERKTDFFPKQVGTVCWLPGLAQVRNPRLLRALRKACELRQIDLHPKCGFEQWQFTHNRVTGVRTSTGETVTARNFIIAAGAWSEQLLLPLGASIGIHPVRGQMVLVRVHAMDIVPMIIAGKRYIVPRGDGLLLIGSTEEPEAGFDKSDSCDSINTLIAFAKSVAPYQMDVNPVIEKTWTGLRPGSADGYPTIGRVPGHDNVLAAVGHFRAGIQLSPGTSRLLKEMILDEPTSINPLPFAFGRPNMSGHPPAFRS